MEAISPSVCRNTKVKCQAQHHTGLDGQFGVAGLPAAGVRRVASQPFSTFGAAHDVRLHRRRRPTSYFAQFLTRNFILGLWWRRGALCLFGIELAAFQ